MSAELRKQASNICKVPRIRQKQGRLGGARGGGGGGGGAMGGQIKLLHPHRPPVTLLQLSDVGLSGWMRILLAVLAAFSSFKKTDP